VKISLDWKVMPVEESKKNSSPAKRAGIKRDPFFEEK